MNAKGQLAQQRINAVLEKTRLLIASRERIQMMKDIAAMQRKQTPTPEKETSQYNAYQHKTSSIENRYKIPMQSADEEVSAAEAEVSKGRFFGIAKASDEAIAKHTAAVKKRDDIRRKVVEESFTAAQELPDGPFKDRVLQQLEQQAALLIEPSETTATEEPAQPTEKTSSTTTPKEPKTIKYTPAQEDWINKAMKANPGMAREQVIEEGKKRRKL